MDDTLVGQLRAGKTATFILFPDAGRGCGHPVSLNGFGPVMTPCRDKVAAGRLPVRMKNR